MPTNWNKQNESAFIKGEACPVCRSVDKYKKDGQCIKCDKAIKNRPEVDMRKVNLRRDLEDREFQKSLGIF